MDALFKREFDGYRARQQPHPLFATVGLDAVPLADPRMDDWRANFTGVRWLDEEPAGHSAAPSTTSGSAPTVA